jgi:hypothetical protein
MEFFKSRAGYYFRNWCVSLVKINEIYTIQIKIPKTQIVYTLYKSKDKPKFRNLGVISLLFPFYFLWIFVSRLPFVIMAFTAIPVMFVGTFLKSIAWLLMFEWWEAKREIIGFYDWVKS